MLAPASVAAPEQQRQHGLKQAVGLPEHGKVQASG